MDINTQTLDENEELKLKQIAKDVRLKILAMSQIAKDTVHFGGSFSATEIFTVLFEKYLNTYKGSFDFGKEDKFLLSKGHAAPGIYALLNVMGIIPDDVLHTYQLDGSEISELLYANPKYKFTTSGGSLGTSLSYGVGLALLAKKKKYTYKTVVLLGDGEIDEGSVWEAIMSASQYGLDNLTIIIDANTVQSDGFTKDIMSWENLQQRLESFGCYVLNIDGHDISQIYQALTETGNAGQPKAIIANTVKGKGVSFMENNYLWHDKVIGKKEFEIARKELENA